MAWSGLNFRASAGFVTDGSGYTYVLPTDSSGTSRGGQTFGYVSTSGNDARDRSAALDARIAGMHFAPATRNAFRWTLPGGAGTYRVRVLFGDNDAPWSHQCVIKDGAGGSTLATITGTTSTARWLDADGTTSITAANVAADAFGDVELTFTASLAEFVFGNGSSSPHSTIAHIAVEEVAASAPVLSSPTGAGGVGVCSGTVSTDEANGTLYAVATASATVPTALQVRNGQDHTGAAALRVVSQEVSATGVQTVASGAITGGAGTRYLHYMHEDAAGNRSAVVSSASFSVTANATANGVTLTAAASLVAGSASGVVNGVLNFQAAGMEFGARTGLGIGTFALEAGVSYRYTIHADGGSVQAPLHTSSTITLDSAGKLPNYVGSAVVPGTTYRVVAIRQTDGEAATFKMVAS